MPEGLSLEELDPKLRHSLISLSGSQADSVAEHLLMATELLDDDPAEALRHARAARAAGSRVGLVREAVGIAAYRAGEWAEARTELRTARRITGDPSNLAVIADCERALGRPDLAVKLLDDPDAGRLDGDARAELLIVAASARRDMGRTEAGLLLLEKEGAQWLDRERPGDAALRVWFVYADLLAEAGRRSEAAEWFRAVARHDREDSTGVREHARELGLALG
ncbi:MAG: tetratricopeptide repeat protein [Frankiaceae bacterium]|nr:tetratricopeptide repeat protein [Frankiaceae bacterium]